jgi:hypothetical protein
MRDGRSYGRAREMGWDQTESVGITMACEKQERWGFGTWVCTISEDESFFSPLLPTYTVAGKHDGQ